MRKIIATAFALLLSCNAIANSLVDIVTKGSTDRSVPLEIIDATDGTPENAVVFNTSGIDLWYRREGAARVAVTEATLAALTTAHTDGGFLYVSDGSYRLDLPDAAFATGANYVDFGGTVTGMIVIGGRVRLIDASLEVANLAANVTQYGGTNGTFSGGRPEVNTTHAAGTAWGSGAITAGAIATDAIGAAEVAADAGTEIGTATWATTTRQLTALDEDVTTMDLNATATGAAASVTGAVGSVTGSVGSVTGAVGSVTGSVGSVASGGISEASFATTAGSFRPLGIARQGTAQSATGTTLVLDSSASFADDSAIGMTLVACGSTQGYCQTRAVTDYVLSTDTATVETWTVTPSGTITYYLFGTAPSSGGGGLDAAGVRAAVGLASANLDTQLTAIDDAVDTEVGAIKTKTDFLPSATAGSAGGVFIAGTNAATTITTGLTTTFTGNLTGSVGSVTGAVGSVTGAVASVTGAVGSVTGNVGGNVTGSVGSVASGGITATSIATDAIGAAEIAADAGTELGTATWATTTRLLTAGTNIALAKGTGVTGFNDPAASAIADAVWDEAQSGHTTPDTFGEYLDSAVSGVSTGGVSAGEIADAVWDEVLSGHVTTGTAGDTLADAAAASGLDAAGVRAAIGLATANLDTQLGDIPTVSEFNARSVASATYATATALQTVDDNVDAVLVDTAEIGTAGAGLTAVDDAMLAAIEQTARVDAAIINCTVNTANFAGSTTTLACILTDRDAGAITAASSDLTGKELLILSGAQIYEGRFINATTWDAANSELRLTLSRALPGTLADAVTAIIR